MSKGGTYLTCAHSLPLLPCRPDRIRVCHRRGGQDLKRRLTQLKSEGDSRGRARREGMDTRRTYDLPSAGWGERNFVDRSKLACPPQFHLAGALQDILTSVMPGHGLRKTPKFGNAVLQCKGMAGLTTKIMSWARGRSPFGLRGTPVMTAKHLAIYFTVLVHQKGYVRTHEHFLFRLKAAKDATRLFEVPSHTTDILAKGYLGYDVYVNGEDRSFGWRSQKIKQKILLTSLNHHRRPSLKALRWIHSTT